MIKEINEDLLYPLISVIIPVYNVRTYLNDAIESVINQTYKNIEIILIDDGSTDGSERICDKYRTKDKRIRIVHQKNQGLSGARNSGLDIMRGDYVAFLDPDDIYLPEMIDALFQIIIKETADVAMCSFYSCKTKHASNKMSTSRFDNIFFIEDGCVTTKNALKLLFYDIINVSVWNKLYKRHLFDGIRFIEGHVYEDQVITPLLIEKADKVAMLSRPLLLHRDNRPGSITTTHSDKNEIDWLYSKKIKETFVLSRKEVFGLNDIKVYRDLLFRNIIVYYVKYIHANNYVSPETKKIYKNEIKKRANDKHICTTKTKVLFRLYKINPYLLYCFKGFYTALKKSLRKIKYLLRSSHG